jgi:hypothetical protein
MRASPDRRRTRYRGQRCTSRLNSRWLMGPLARQGMRRNPATPNSARLSSLPSISHPLPRICNPIPDSAMIFGRYYRGCTRRNVLPA